MGTRPRPLLERGELVGARERAGEVRTGGKKTKLFRADDLLCERETKVSLPGEPFAEKDPSFAPRDGSFAAIVLGKTLCWCVFSRNLPPR
jgi:hypothetical protein